MEGIFIGGLLTLLLAVFAVLYLARRPTLQIDDDGVRFRSIWDDRFVEWTQISSVHTGGWGPSTYLALVREKGWPIYIPQWFEPSSTQLESDILKIRDQLGTRPRQ
jgi:hypothetical protein